MQISTRRLTKKFYTLRLAAMKENLFSYQKSIGKGKPSFILVLVVITLPKDVLTLFYGVIDARLMNTFFL